MIHTREINEAVQTRVMVTNNNEVYKIGDRVRVQFVAKNIRNIPTVVVALSETLNKSIMIILLLIIGK